jgi:hypothetical protein
MAGKSGFLVSPGVAAIMPTQSESPAAVIGTSSKTLHLLRKRLRQVARVTLVLAIGLALAATALAVWWSTSLNGLPDIGDPFDVAAFRALRVPEDRNAFAFLRRADRMLTEWPVLPRPVGQSAPTVAWSKADPKLRAWVEANRPALEVFQRGAEQLDAGLAGDPSTDINPGTLSILALLEGSRRQESGDTAGAWDCYRAVLRMAAHVSGRGTLEQRFRVDMVFLARGWLQKRLATWAADPKTTISQLRSVLDEVQKTEAKSDADSFALKTGYLETMRELDRPMNWYERQGTEGEWTVRLGDMQLSGDNIDSIIAVRRFLLREPERSRRVLRLLCANWLAYVEIPRQRRPQPAVRAVLTGLKPITLMLYPVSPDAPAGARALPPREIASWLVSTDDARLQLLGMRPWSPGRHAYRRAHREIVITLATEIYHRERGALPASNEALVGTYLKSLPDDGSADPANETTPTVK